MGRDGSWSLRRRVGRREQGGGLEGENKEDDDAAPETQTNTRTECRISSL